MVKWTSRLGTTLKKMHDKIDAVITANHNVPKYLQGIDNSAKPDNGWFLIESIKETEYDDGRAILLCCKGGIIMITGDSTYHAATHWQPMPKLPQIYME